MAADSDNVDGRRETARFRDIDFDRFRELARDTTLTEVEKMGFARGHREGFDDAIWSAIRAALPALGGRNARILDIGPGCGELARRMIAAAEAGGHRLVLVDHQEMLGQLPASSAVEPVAGRFPADMPQQQGFDAILVYSVLHSVITDANPFAFVDEALARLNPGGRLLIGDIPNASKLRRFLAGEAGAAFHRAYMRTEDAPQLSPFALATGRIDDGLILGLVARARMAGFDAYILPQPADLPFANRREDLLFIRP